ncbi:MAG: alpha/beta hydrolase [Candidatus Methanoliparum thermophilum]|uniref:Alpha/beta hydrolase n=1 Tax=Methanoliparum thermophilum TaxID=2491083 RepID=A0A520KSB4_METT2|nr:hypothetical protein [Candidatus Methanoliparum sp. LAM-1]RZN64112.1 MAG: alpha/beta hydrolase [Candidatus Methanoliparum thermophilum]BDC35625.1 hypothetical protein MTLP_03070 [Candidatus Methanoliparum sp. LAM-1]
MINRDLKFLGENDIIHATLYERSSDKGVILAPPHPLLGGCRCDMRLVEIAGNLYDEGISVLAIDYRSEYSGGLGEIKDVKSAIDFVGWKEISLVGYSFGATVVSNIVDDRIKSLVLISIVKKIGDIEAKIDTYYRKLFIHGNKDNIAPFEEFLELYKEAAGEKRCIVYDTDHFYLGFIEEVAKSVSDYIMNVFDDFQSNNI